jgi:CBS domain-containing protein
MVPLPQARARSAPLEEAVALLARRAGRSSAASDQAEVSSPVHALFDNETLEQALRQLVLYGHQGLPVLAEDGHTIVGWVTNRDVMRTIARRLGQNVLEVEEGARAAEFAIDNVEQHVHQAHAQLAGYRLVTAVVPRSEFATLRIDEVEWPDGALAVAVRRGTASFTVHGHTELRPGDVLTILTPVGHAEAVAEALLLAATAAEERDDEEAS